MKRPSLRVLVSEKVEAKSVENAPGSPETLSLRERNFEIGSEVGGRRVETREDMFGRGSVGAQESVECERTDTRRSARVLDAPDGGTGNLAVRADTVGESRVAVDGGSTCDGRRVSANVVCDSVERECGTRCVM